LIRQDEGAGVCRKNARVLEEEDEAIKSVSENDGTVIGSARFQTFKVNKEA